MLERLRAARRRRRPAARARGSASRRGRSRAWSAASASASPRASPGARRSSRRPTRFLPSDVARARPARRDRATASRAREPRVRTIGGVFAGRARVPCSRRRAPAAPRAASRRERPDERAVVLVGDLARAVVELELLERRERAVALLGEREPRARPRPGVVERVARPAPARAGTAARRTARRRRRARRRGRARAVTRGRGACGAVALGEPPLLARVRPQRDQRAEHEDEAGEPDQVHERLHEHLEVDASPSG